MGAMLVASDVSKMETAGDSSIASGSSASDMGNNLGERGSDSSPDLYMMVSDSGRSESDSNITLAMDDTFNRLEKAYRALR